VTSRLPADATKTKQVLPESHGANASMFSTRDGGRIESSSRHGRAQSVVVGCPRSRTIGGFPGAGGKTGDQSLTGLVHRVDQQGEGGDGASGPALAGRCDGSPSGRIPGREHQPNGGGLGRSLWTLPAYWRRPRPGNAAGRTSGERGAAPPPLPLRMTGVSPTVWERREDFSYSWHARGGPFQGGATTAPAPPSSPFVGLIIRPTCRPFWRDFLGEALLH